MASQRNCDRSAPLYNENGSPLYDEDVPAPAAEAAAAGTAKDDPKAKVKAEAARPDPKRLFAFAAYTPDNVDSAKVTTNPYLPEGHPRRKSFDPSVAAATAKNPTKLPPPLEDDDDEDNGPPPLYPRNYDTDDDSDDDSDDDDDDKPILQVYNQKKKAAAKQGQAGKKSDPKSAEAESKSNALPTTIFHEGRKYHKHHGLVDGGQSMRCSNYKHPINCKGRIKVDKNRRTTVMNADHNDPLCAEKNNLDVAAANQPRVAIPNVTDEQERFVDCEAIMHLSKPAADIADECTKEMKRRYGDSFTGLDWKQLRSRVYNTRQRNGGGVEKKRIQMDFMTGGVQSFCRAQHSWVDEEGKQQEIMAFSKKDLLDRLKAKQSQVSSKIADEL